MLSRGRGAHPEPKQAKNGNWLLGTSIKAKVFGVLLVSLLAFLVFADVTAGQETETSDTGTTTTGTETTQTGPTEAELQAIRYYDGLTRARKKKADHWRHARTGGHRPYAHTYTKPAGSVAYAKYRASKWATIVSQEYAAYKAMVRACINAGFPRWYCPILSRAAHAEGRPTWSRNAALAWIIQHESGFRPCVMNGGRIDCSYRGGLSYGLFQFIGSTWAGVGCRITSDPYWQTRCGIRYIKRRYGTPEAAKNWWLSHKWY